MKIIGIDPGTTQSGWAVLVDGKVESAGVAENEHLLYWIASEDKADLYAIERFEARGMPMSEDSIETVIYTGRLYQECVSRNYNVVMLRRRQVKLHLCGTSKAKDANIRTALIDRHGDRGTKKNPGGTYGVSSHAWAALAVATLAMDEAKGLLATS